MKGARALSGLEIQSVCAEFDGIYAVRNQTLFLLCANVGTRITEALNLNVSDVFQSGKYCIGALSSMPDPEKQENRRRADAAKRRTERAYGLSCVETSNKGVAGKANVFVCLAERETAESKAGTPRLCEGIRKSRLGGTSHDAQPAQVLRQDGAPKQRKRFVGDTAGAQTHEYRDDFSVLGHALRQCHASDAKL